MKRYLIGLLVAIFALCAVCTLSIADSSTQIVEYAADNELTPYSFEEFQDRLSIELDEKWKQFVFFFPKNNHVEVDENILESLPVMAFDQHEVVLFIFNRDSKEQQWNLSSTNENALIPRVEQGHIKLRAFSCWLLREEKNFLEIAIYYSVETNDENFAISSHFAYTEHSKTNWQFATFSVQPSKAVKSQYIPQLSYDTYVWGLSNNTNGYIKYAKDEEDILGFEFNSLDIQQFNAKEFDINKYLSPLALMTYTVVDTSEHGNGKTLTLRDKPNGKKIGKISNGSEVFISSMQNDWAFIIGKDKAGFVDAKFIKNTDAYLQINKKR